MHRKGHHNDKMLFMIWTKTTGDHDENEDSRLIRVVTSTRKERKRGQTQLIGTAEERFTFASRPSRLFSAMLTSLLQISSIWS